VIAAQNADCARETARVIDELSHVRVGGVPFLRHSHLVRVALTCTRESIALRERARLKQALLYSRLRRLSLAIGDRLVERGTLALRDDVFFLAHDELDALLSSDAILPGSVGEVIRARRAEHERLSASQPPDTVVLPLGTTWSPEASSAPVEDSRMRLDGVATCGGRAEAPAAIVRDMSEAHLLQAGDVLVTRQTDPGWAPVFFLIRGLVMERGGMLSHGAIIAREFGIPAVVGVKDATRRISARQVVRIDGDAGHVDLV
jgi:pyruvate,water dikinase